MDKTLYIIGLIIIQIFGCKQIENNKEYDLDIRGDWVTNYFEDRWSRKIITFSFQDSLCSIISPYGDFKKYQINGDTLTVTERERESDTNINGREESVFLIKKIDSQNLKLVPLTHSTKSLLRKGFKNKIKLSKVIQKNDIKFDRIAFYSTVCHGTCPSMYLEIDSIGNLLFLGRGYTDKDGAFIGKIDENELGVISQKINSIQLDNLEKFYSSNWTDDQTCGVKIKAGNNVYESHAYGFNTEPVELRILFHKLMEIYKEAELKSDTMVAEKFQLEELIYRGYPPVPPPPPNKKK
ncbi:MAG TPA: hypothetical protein ENJ95_23845 [Bacteroidetes bacterium]|nr:hypothetical protein [Bacteroidota bacterium]